jgi:hypothetical protein
VEMITSVPDTSLLGNANEEIHFIQSACPVGINSRALLTIPAKGK